MLQDEHLTDFLARFFIHFGPHQPVRGSYSVEPFFNQGNLEMTKSILICTHPVLYHVSTRAFAFSFHFLSARKNRLREIREIDEGFFFKQKKLNDFFFLSVSIRAKILYKNVVGRCCVELFLFSALVCTRDARYNCIHETSHLPSKFINTHTVRFKE